jgi:hypothetical protein
MTFAPNDRIIIAGRKFIVVTARSETRYTVREDVPRAHVQVFFKYNGTWRLGAKGVESEVSL